MVVNYHGKMFYNIGPLAELSTVEDVDVWHELNMYYLPVKTNLDLKTRLK